MSSALLILLGAIGALATVAVLFLGWVLQALSAKEAEAAIEAMISDLLQRAERRLPAQHRARFSEETRAGLQELGEKRPLWSLFQAASLLRAAWSGSLAAEFEALEEEEREEPGFSRDTAWIFAHPLRVRVLARLCERAASPAEMARELGVPPSTLAYHFQTLQREGLIEVTEAKVVRGLTVRIFKARRQQHPPRD
jgi:DNA-binding transcriptional ArsR family regulator